MRRRIFHSGQPEPIGFTIYGERRDGSEWTEDYDCLGRVAPSVLLTLMSTVSIDTRGRAAYQVPALISFVNQLLVPDDRDRWAALMSDDDRLLDPAVLAELVEWLSEEVFGRPLARRTGSASSSPPAETSSSPGSSSPAATSPTSTPATSSP